jgi:hypothetical protein
MFLNRLGAPVLLTQSQGEAADCTARRSSGSGAAHATVPTTAMPLGGYRATAVTSDHHAALGVAEYVVATWHSKLGLPWGPVAASSADMLSVYLNDRHSSRLPRTTPRRWVTGDGEGE